MRLDASLSCAGLPALGLRAGGGTPAPGPTFVTPLVSTAASLPGDTRPTYSIDFVAAYPDGGGIGDTLEGRWGTSLVAMQAMTPESVVIDEGMFIDGDDPFPALGTFSAAQALGTTIYFSFRVVRGTDASDWSNTGTLLLEDGTMDAPGLTDLTDQAASTRVWSAPFSVSGLAAGAYARLEGTGPIRVGGVTVYEAGEQAQVQNGDGLEFGVDTAAGSGVTVDNVVSNRGAALETFSATRAGVSVQAVAATPSGDRTVTAAYSTTVANFDVTFEAGYALVMIPGLPDDATRNVVSVTVGGVAATKIVIAGGTTDRDMYICAVTAGAKAVVITTDTNFNYVRALFCTLKNCNTVPTAVGGTSGSAAGDLDTGVLTILADGLAIGLGDVAPAIAPVTCIEGTEIGGFTDPVDGTDYSIAYQTVNGARLRWSTGGHNTKGRMHAIFAAA